MIPDDHNTTAVRRQLAALPLRARRDTCGRNRGDRALDRRRRGAHPRFPLPSRNETHSTLAALPCV